MLIYMEQSAFVKWGNKVSEPFRLSNLTRQGSEIGPVIGCVYTKDLIKELRQLGLGCRIHNIFLGIMVYADDVILLCPSRSASRRC